MMESKKSFSLQSLFLWCSVAAALLSVVGLGYRGVEWAAGSSWALLAGMIVLAVISALYWIAHRVALILEGFGVTSSQASQAIPLPVSDPDNEFSPEEVTVNIHASEETRI